MQDLLTKVRPSFLIDGGISYTILIKRDIKENLPILNAGEFGFCTDTKEVYIGDGFKNYPINSTISEVQKNLGIFPTDFTGEHSPYNFATVTGIRDTVPFTEFWILINAYYDYDTNRFKRVDVNNFSFGWQLQGGGTYPGEGSIGDFINQGVNLWKANEKAAYPGDDDYNTWLRDQTNEDIGAIQADGSWREFGIMLGWNNSFMSDAYGGMTIGGAGFEIYGSGMSPFKRVSLGKFSGGSDDPNKKPEDYIFAYNGDCWNTQHGLWNKDEDSLNGYFLGMRSPVNYYDQDPNVYNSYSNRATLSDETDSFVWMVNRGNQSPHIEHWEDIINVKATEEAKIKNKELTKTEGIVVETAEDQINGQQSWSISYPSGCTKDNCFIMASFETMLDDTYRQTTNNVYSFTDYGVNMWGEDVSKDIKLIFSRYA